MTLLQDKEVLTEISFTHPDVTAALHYGKNRFKGELEYARHEIPVVNARAMESAPTLDDCGFALVDHRTAVRDFSDLAAIEPLYREEMRALIEKLTGARKVIVFHMQVRDNSESAHEDIRRPAIVPHIDYDEKTFGLRAREELGEEADQWLSRRYIALNVWRGIRPVEEWPLAVCDARTVREEDFRKTIIHEKPGEPTPYVGLPLTYEAGQKWYYFPDMQPDETLIFKQCDTDHANIRWSPHVAIDVDAKAGPEPRLSIEVRTIAFF
jgi:hypothetical protein